MEIDKLNDDNEHTSWHGWCRLCAKEDPEGNISVFTKTEQNNSAVTDAETATAIGKYFWVNIRANDILPTYLCSECSTLVKFLVNFTERINKVQAMFSVLQNTKNVNPTAIREQFSLFDSERDHIIKPKPEEIEEELSFKILHDGDEVDEDGNAVPCELEHYDVHQMQNVVVEEDDENDGKETLTEYIVDDEEEVEEHQQQRKRRMIKQHKSPVKSSRRLIARRSALNAQKHETEYVIDIDDEHLEHQRDSTGDALTEEEKQNDVDDDVDGDEHIKNKSNDNTDADEDIEYEIHDVLNSKTNKDDENENENVNKRKRRSRSINGYRLMQRKEDSYTDYKYECKICERKYKNATSYRKHMISLHDVAPDIPEFVCEKCNKVLPTEKQLAMHQRTHLPLEEKLDIPCPYCEKKFTKIAVMNQHVRGIHHNEKPYICDECGRALKTLAALNEHKLVHTDECPYKCEVCDKGFKNNARLKVHMDTHNDTNYVCTICGTQLNTRRTLKMHMLVHSNNRRYKCEFCGSEFKRSKALKNHLILHSGIRPYKCNFCGKAFSNGSNCRSHKKKIHPRELAEEEAMGRKSEPITVPKLEELRSCTNIIKNPRKISRVGLPMHMRAILLAAEERSKNKETLQNEAEMEEEVQQVYEDCEIKVEDSMELEGMEIEIHDADVEEDEEETVIYEIIDEI